MKKIDKAVEIVRGWSDEEIKAFIVLLACPEDFDMKDCEKCKEYKSDRYRGCNEGWNEEIE